MKFRIIIIILSFFLINSCGLYKKTDNTVPQNAQDRARKNVTEGKGVSLNNFGKSFSKTNYEFASSNPLWRASLEIIDFMPLTTIDYSGGIIITDWFQDEINSNISLKITIRFLDNIVSANSIKIIVHEKKCLTDLKCVSRQLEKSKINEELLVSILKKAAIYEKEKK